MLAWPRTRHRANTAGKQFLDDDVEQQLKNAYAHHSGYTSDCVRQQMLAWPRTRHRANTAGKQFLDSDVEQQLKNVNAGPRTRHRGGGGDCR